MPRVTADMTITLEGGPVFHFVTEGIDAALERARDAAGEKDVSTAGGPWVLNQYLAGAEGVELTPVSSRATPHVTHLVYHRAGA